MSEQLVAILVTMAIAIAISSGRTPAERLIGSGLLILAGLSLVLIEDSIPMMILFGATIIMGGQEILKAGTEIIN